MAGSPVVSLRAWLWGGSRCEATPGLAWATGRMLVEGSRRRGWRALAEEAEGLGMVLGSFGTLEVHGVAIDCLARDWRRAARLVDELLWEASFPDERCRWVCTQGVAELESVDDQPDTKTAWAFNDQLYHPHAAGRPCAGTREGLATIDGEACRRFHVQARERGGVLALAGDVEESEVAAEIADLLRLPPPGRPGEAADEAVGATEPRRAVATAARDQSHLFVGHRTVPADHPDLPALDLASIVLGAGSGLTGRIPTRVREREGLAYSATAGLTAGAGLDAGRLVVHVATSPAQVARAEACVREEIGRLCDEGVSETEVEEARSYVLRREPFRRETARQWAGLLARSSLYGMPVDDAAWVEARYRALDRAAVEAAIRRHLEPARLQVTVGSPASGAARAVC